MTVEVREYSMKDIIPACVMENINKERQAEKEKEEEIKRLKEEERKANIIKAVVKCNGLIEKINNILKEHGIIQIQTGRFDNNSYSENSWGWELNDTHYVNGQYNLIENVYNDELVFTLLDLYKKAGYKTYNHRYSSGYYKNYEITIYAKANCDTCEI
jgi:hypothetical protein